MVIKKPKGTRDIYGSLCEKYRYIEDVFREICKRYNFRELRTPIFEYKDLYKSSLGENTDVVNKEMFEFKDAGGREVVLRPEGTAGIIRSYIEEGINNKKIYYYGTMYRQERPALGRYREFRQAGVESIGVNSTVDEVEIIQIVNEIFNSLGIEYELYINTVGCFCRKKLEQELKIFLENKKSLLGEKDKERLEEEKIMRILDSKDEDTQSVIKLMPFIKELVCDSCKIDYDKLRLCLDRLGMGYFEDNSLVRGLDYYTGNVFEVYIRGRKDLGAVCGGGRYDGLVERLGGKKESCCGFAIGMDRIVDFVGENKDWKEKGVDYYVITVGSDLNVELKAIEVASKYRYKNRVEIDAGNKSIKSKLRRANKEGAEKVIIIGEDEIEKGLINIKDLRTGEDWSQSLTI